MNNLKKINRPSKDKLIAALESGKVEITLIGDDRGDPFFTATLVPSIIAEAEKNPIVAEDPHPMWTPKSERQDCSPTQFSAYILEGLTEWDDDISSGWSDAFSVGAIKYITYSHDVAAKTKSASKAPKSASKPASKASAGDFTPTKSPVEAAVTVCRLLKVTEVDVDNITEIAINSGVWQTKAGNPQRSMDDCLSKSDLFERVAGKKRTHKYLGGGFDAAEAKLGEPVHWSELGGPKQKPKSAKPKSSKAPKKPVASPLDGDVVKASDATSKKVPAAVTKLVNSYKYGGVYTKERAHEAIRLLFEDASILNWDIKTPHVVGKLIPEFRFHLETAAESGDSNEFRKAFMKLMGVSYGKMKGHHIANVLGYRIKKTYRRVRHEI